MLTKGTDLKKLSAVACLVFSIFFWKGFSAGAASDTGSISGRILPTDAAVRIIAKAAGAAYETRGNIKGEFTLTRGGEFTITGLPAGKYDLLFVLEGESAKRYIASRWSEIVVHPGECVAGINYRLTPQGADHMIDEVLVAFRRNTSAEEALATIRAAGCTVKDAPVKAGVAIIYTVDIPDSRSVEEMIEIFRRQPAVISAQSNGIATVAIP